MLRCVRCSSAFEVDDMTEEGNCPFCHPVETKLIPFGEKETTDMTNSELEAERDGQLTRAMRHASRVEERIARLRTAIALANSERPSPTAERDEARAALAQQRHPTPTQEATDV